MAMPISVEEFEKRCISKISAIASYEKDTSLKADIESVGNIICKCMASQITSPRALRRVMSAAVQTIPAYTVGR